MVCSRSIAWALSIIIANAETIKTGTANRTPLLASTTPSAASNDKTSPTIPFVIPNSPETAVTANHSCRLRDLRTVPDFDLSTTIREAIEVPIPFAIAFRGRVQRRSLTIPNYGTRDKGEIKET